MATKQQKIQALKKQFDDNAARKPKLAIETAVELERLEPGEPRWSHKRGELLQRQGNKEAAVEAYSLAVEKYAGRGFLPRAIAMAKIVLDLDPTRTWVMESLDQSEARQRHRESRVGIDLNDMLSDQKPLDRVAKVLAPAPSNGTDDLRFDDSAPVVLGMSRGELSTVIADAPREESDAGAMPAVPLFANAPQDAFERLVNGSQLAYADEGEIVLAPGDPSDSLYIIVEGEALVVSVEGDELAVLAEGDVFGESCLLPDGKRSATIKARDLLTTL
ncbi:MAG: cyclic nucleotide-binding domain-containing protein, partial [Myxococcales bacterium]|nr:cyclic nucleotide-binding domain-containing protein [Myxococcales bacterium]